MLGAIIGDIVGSIYEFNNIKSKDFKFFSPRCNFTDDTVMTIATYKALEKCGGKYRKLSNYTVQMKQEYARMYPSKGYGLGFRFWMNSDSPQPYNSYGNGAAMCISPVAYYAKSLDKVKKLSYDVVRVTHDHPEGIKGAEATAVAIWMARNKYSKEEIYHYINDNYYNLNFNYEELRNDYTFKVSCQETVPQAIYCFLISKSFEDAIRTGVSIGGDSDTLCAIIGSIAEAYYGIPQDIKEQALNYLDERILDDYMSFQNKFETELIN